MVIEGLGDYGARDIFAYVRPGETTGNVYLYLPNGNYEFKIGRAHYAATVNGLGTEAKLVSVDPEPPPTATVTFGRELVHLTAAWTSGDGSVTNAISGTTFEVLKGTTGVKVIFTPEDRYGLDKTEYAFAEAITDDCEIPEKDLPTATYLYVTVTVEQLVHLTAAWTSGDGTVTNAIRSTSFEVLKGTTDVKIVFTPEQDYRFAEVGETGVRALASPLAEGCTVTPPTVEAIPGTEADPWVVGTGVRAYMGDEGTLVITGTGAMDDFASATDVPWDPAAVVRVTVADDVALGKNALAALSDTVQVSVTASIGSMRSALGTTAQPAGSVSADFESIDIVDGKAYLGVAVLTNGELTATTEGWGVATNVVIEVPAPGKSGFFILKRGAKR